MRTLGQAMVVSLLVAGLTLPAAAQSYEPPRHANHKDVYCSGFVAAEELPSSLRIVMAEDAVGRIVYSQYDYVYLSHGRNGGVTEGAHYLVVRPVNDPNPIQAFTEYPLSQWQFSLLEKMGQPYYDIGTVEVKYVHETVSTAMVREACMALNAGDVLIPYEQRPVPEYKPERAFDRFAPPSGLTDGVVVVGKEFGHALGQGDIFYANLGSEQGIKAGDYLTLYRQASGTRYDGYDDMGKGMIRRQRGMPYGYEIPKMRQDLPREVLGEALVVRADRKSATALITLSLREIHAGDFVELQPPAPPLAKLSVYPAQIVRGDAAMLSWNVQAAYQAAVTPAIGTVSDRGSVQVRPQQTTTYNLTATGPGGAAEDSVTVTVVAPPPPRRRVAPVRAPSLEELFEQSVEDVFFEFNKAEITEQAAAKLQRVADFLLSNPQARILVEGHADEVGTEQYNLALGGRRAQAVVNYLVESGVDPAQLTTVSLGESQPFCRESSEDWCRALNRRAHFVLQP